MENEKKLLLIEEIKETVKILPEEYYDIILEILNSLSDRISDNNIVLKSEKKFLASLLRSYYNYKNFIAEHNNRGEVIISQAKEYALEIYKYECEELLNLYKKIFIDGNSDYVYVVRIFSLIEKCWVNTYSNC